MSCRLKCHLCFMLLVSSYKIKVLLLSMEGHLVLESLPPQMHSDNISSNMGNIFFRFPFHPTPGALVVYVLLWTSCLCCGRPWQASRDDFNSAEFSACEACAIYIGEASCGTVVMEIRWSLQPILQDGAKMVTPRIPPGRVPDICYGVL